MVDPVDYSAYLSSIASSLATIATNTTSMKTSLESIDASLESMDESLEGMKTNSDTIVSYLLTMKNDITRIRDLGDRNRDGNGFRTVQPYGEIGLAILWLLYIERGKILEFELDESKIADLLDNNLGGNEQVRAASIARVKELFGRLTGSFSEWGDQ